MGIKSLCKIHSDNLFLLQMHFQETKNRQVSKMNGTPPYEAPFWGNPCAGLASMNLGKFEEGVLAGKKLLEVQYDLLELE